MTEALARGHDVTAVVRDPARVPQLPVDVRPRIGDARYPADVATVSVGHDLVISATRLGRATVLDDPRYLAPEYRDIALACHEQRAVCRSQVDVDWTYLSPPARLEPGTRTGSYRSGSDELVVDDDGSSRISLEDLAVALLDEAERPKHQRARFSSGLLTNFEVG